MIEACRILTGEYVLPVAAAPPQIKLVMCFHMKDAMHMAGRVYTSIRKHYTASHVHGSSVHNYRLFLSLTLILTIQSINHVPG